MALVEPLKTTLARKKARFEAAQAALGEVAAAGSAEAQRLATAQSAALYQDFGRAVLASQRPRGLSKADAQAYQQLLEEQARPFEEKAAELLRLNAGRSPADNPAANPVATPNDTPRQTAAALPEPRR